MIEMPYSSVTIHLENVRANYSILKKRVGSLVECAAVLKADAYGLGIEKIAPALYEEGCRHFFVAYNDESLALHHILESRRVNASIYVLNGPYLKGWESYFHKYNFIPVINRLDELEVWHTYAKSQNQKLPVVLHFETGMNRLALTPQELQTYMKQQWPFIDIKHIMSHLACADDYHHSMNIEQLKNFNELSKNFPNVPQCLGSSSGIFLGSQYHLNMVRPGMAILGLNPTPYQHNPMKPCVTVKSRILQVKDVECGQSVGYGQSTHLTTPTRVGTLALGYADGIPWRLSNQNGYVMYNGKTAPIIGRVSMDLVNVDLTNTPEADVGDWVEVINNTITIDEIAKRSGNISYQVLINLGKRLKKSYTDSIVSAKIHVVS